MKLTKKKTQQVTTLFFLQSAEQNTTGTQQQLFTSASCEHREDFARETRERKKKKKKKDTLATNNTLRYVQACSLHSDWVQPSKEMRVLCGTRTRDSEMKTAVGCFAGPGLRNGTVHFSRRSLLTAREKSTAEFNLTRGITSTQYISLN